jgi:hypothetical protein
MGFGLQSMGFSTQKEAGIMSSLPDVSYLIPSMRIKDQIKILEVQTEFLLLNLSGHQYIVRDLSFRPSGCLSLVSES